MLVQAAPTALTLATQTTWYRPVNKAVQFESDAANAPKAANRGTHTPHSPSRHRKAHIGICSRDMGGMGPSDSGCLCGV